MKHHLALILAGALMVPGFAHAIDGQPMTSGSGTGLSAEANNTERGVSVIQRWLLCDGDPGTSKTCTVFDTNKNITSTTTTGGTKMGVPSRAVFSVDTGTSCTGTNTVTPQGSQTDDLTTKISLGPPGATTLNIGDQMVVEPVPNRYLTATIAADASCTDLEVVLQLFYDKGDSGGGN